MPYQNVDGEGHDEAGDEQVGHGEGHDEEVGDVLQQLLPAHAQYHQHVAEDDAHAELHVVLRICQQVGYDKIYV